MKEIWRDIEGYEGLYQVNSLGEIRSNDRIDCCGRLCKGKTLKTNIGTNKRVMVSLAKDGKPHCFQISRIVAKAFPEICGEWFDNCEVHHIDGNPHNNVAQNLKVLSQEEHRLIHNPPKKYKFDWWRERYL